MKNVGKAICDRCGQEKECVELDVNDESWFWKTTERYKICETCASQLFKLYRKDQ